MENFFDFSPLKIVARGHFSLEKRFSEVSVPNEKRAFTNEKMLRFRAHKMSTPNEKTLLPDEDFSSPHVNRNFSLRKIASTAKTLMQQGL